MPERLLPSFKIRLTIGVRAIIQCTPNPIVTLNRVVDILLNVPGECDADHISLINLVHAMTKEVSGSSELPSGGFTVRAELPWSRDTIVVLTDSELIYVFREFGNRGYDHIRFQIEKTPQSPIDEPEVVEQIGWCNKEAGMFDFTVESEGLDGIEDEGLQTSEGVQNEGVENGGDVHAGEGLDGDIVDESEITKQCMALFDGQKGGEIKFFVGQIFGSKEEMGDIFREYAIRECVTLGRVKNDNVRQTYVCDLEGCPWRAHGSRTIDKKSFIIKTLDDKHDCHRVYNNSEAKVKWITSRVESLVKSNPLVGAKVLGDLILERHLCFMSDRQKGLVKALQTHFPLASTRSSYPCHNCKKMFWKASRSSNLFHFNAALDSIGEVDPKAKQWLMKIDPHCWSRFGYDQYIRCDHVTNNMTEAFNNMFGTHRAQTYLQLMEFIRLKLKEYYCGCEIWQTSGIPCPHAMVAISHSCGRRSLKDWVPNFVHQSLSKSSYIQTYRGMIHPLPDQNMWPTIETDELLPPPYATQPGRPKLQRKREAGEKEK
ncbi:hypothetical protein Ddye_000417 [Dipteronia dyeriana]|uniref:SWIM-type domain-containing protein n=1 Tax=Dipteronia dyeriana TaxID=168575 RepID=A0AAE0CT26_9ROSI|nr:hypothetical protein Ddye_000417 [Dipteronia dyeriana]